MRADHASLAPLRPGGRETVISDFNAEILNVIPDFISPSCTLLGIK